MSADNFPTRLPQNTPGKFYVDEQCLDCDLCYTTAPTVFGRDDSEGVAYINKQPETKEEIELTIESIEGCPCEAIHSDGDQFDWSSPRHPRPAWRQENSPKPACSHCKPPQKPWWKFWA